MDKQTFFYQGSYHPQGNFIPHYLEQSQTYFTGLPFESQEPADSSPAVPNFPSPVEYREQRRRRLLDRTIENLKDSELPGAELSITYLTHQFRRNCKGLPLQAVALQLHFS